MGRTIDHRQVAARKGRTPPDETKRGRDEYVRKRDGFGTERTAQKRSSSSPGSLRTRSCTSFCPTLPRELLSRPRNQSARKLNKKLKSKSTELGLPNTKAQKLHPEQDESTVQGILSLMFHLERMLAEITGMSRMTLQPAAGAHGEYLGCLITRSFHRSKNELEQRTEMIVPDSAHGTNPASAA